MAGGMSHRDRSCHHRIYSFNPELKAGAAAWTISRYLRPQSTDNNPNHHRRRDDGDLSRGSAHHPSKMAACEETGRRRTGGLEAMDPGQ